MPAKSRQPEPSGGLRVLVLSKRRYMSRDLLDDRYGRFRELPLALAAEGAEVQGLCLSYRGRGREVLLDGAVRWTSLDLGSLASVGEQGYWRTLDAIGRELRPQLVWACSDVPHARLGRAVAGRLGARLVIDLYDNFESYPLSRLPGVNALLRASVRAAQGVTCISAPLLRKVRGEYGFRGPALVLENAIPADSFRPGDRAAARLRFGLPADALLVGTAGALTVGRGVDVLLEAFARLARERADAHLVLAGPLDGSLSLPRDERVHYLGSLPPESVPALLPALDLSVICNRDSEFGRYCFPQKLYESLACGLPVAVANVGAMGELLAGQAQYLYEPGSSESLLSALRRLAATPSSPALPVPTWPELGRKLSGFLRSVAQADMPEHVWVERADAGLR